MLSFIMKKQPQVEFICYQDDLGNIPEPYPARKLIPEWYKALPMKLGSGFRNNTLKRCPPFLDAMVTGWIIPLVADVHLKSNHDCTHIEYSWNYPRPMIENHLPSQVTASKCPAPHESLPPMKWMNWWLVKCPPGYSLLFTPPLNRPDKRFTCLTGLVDSDGYFEFVNFPFFWTEPNFDGIIPAGTPLMQVIPIKRDTLFNKSTVRGMNDKDLKELANTLRKRESHESHYRDNIWIRK